MAKFEVVSPVDDSVYVERSYSSEKIISDTLSQAVAAQRQWAETTFAERKKYCLALVDHIVKDKEVIANEICQQMGRPIRYCEGEINGFADRAKTMIDIAEKKLQTINCNDQKSQNKTLNRYIERVPLGTVLSIVPWNYPFLTAVNSIIPAIMAGNTVIMKPSSQTPLTAERIFSASQKAGLPVGVFSYLYLTHADTERLIENKHIDFVCFTGSVKGGERINLASSDRFIGLGLELGGKDPAYVRHDADINYSVESLVDGAFFNAGQSCCGIERIYVHEQIYAEFVDAFCRQVRQYKLGNPLDPQTTLGPMVNARPAELVRQQVSDALSKGATALIEESEFLTSELGSAYLAPQVLVDVDHSMSVMVQESFGPVVGIMKVKDDDEAIALMNDSDYGLTASVWTKDEKVAIDIGKQVQTGTWFMNRCDYLDPLLAWTGVKNSGRGCTLSEIGYEQLTRPKSYYLKQT